MSAPVMPARDHQPGCPVVTHPERAGRVESYVLTRPAERARDGRMLAPAQPVRVTRCMDCAAAVYDEVSQEEATR